MNKSTLLKIARAMLERAGILFAANGYNDVNLAELVPDVKERRALALAIATWNGNPTQYDPKGKYELGLDWVLMQFAAAMLTKHIQGAEMLEAVSRGEVTLSIAPEDVARIGPSMYRPTVQPTIYAGVDETEPLASPLELDVETHVIAPSVIDPGSMLSSISASAPTPPVIEERVDGWYWHDETWSPNGPHATREIAQAELDKYVLELEGPPESDPASGET